LYELHGDVAAGSTPFWESGFFASTGEASVVSAATDANRIATTIRMSVLRSIRGPFRIGIVVDSCLRHFGAEF
jgi:hypothetical protein